jgi:uncharacterized membrane protein
MAKLYLIALPVFLLIDFIWLGLITKNFYSNQIGFLMKDNVNWLAAGIFYLLFVLGLVIFVITPALKEESLTKALLFGSLFGLITYATYDLTNLATVKNWPILVTVVDLVWGAVLSASVSVITFLIARSLKFN